MPFSPCTIRYFATVGHVHETRQRLLADSKDKMQWLYNQVSSTAEEKITTDETYKQTASMFAAAGGGGGDGGGE